MTHCKLCLRSVLLLLLSYTVSIYSALLTPHSSCCVILLQLRLMVCLNVISFDYPFPVIVVDGEQTKATRPLAYSLIDDSLFESILDHRLAVTLHIWLTSISNVVQVAWKWTGLLAFPSPPLGNLYIYFLLQTCRCIQDAGKVYDIAKIWISSADPSRTVPKFRPPGHRSHPKAELNEMIQYSSWHS